MKGEAFYTLASSPVVSQTLAHAMMNIVYPRLRLLEVHRIPADHKLIILIEDAISVVAITVRPSFGVVDGVATVSLVL